MAASPPRVKFTLLFCHRKIIMQLQHINTQFIGIFATSSNGVIGCDNHLPWNIPEDISFFHKLTNGNIIIMGRKTFESLPSKKGLPGRVNIILSKKKSLKDKPNIALKQEPNKIYSKLSLKGLVMYLFFYLPLYLPPCLSVCQSINLK